MDSLPRLSTINNLERQVQGKISRIEGHDDSDCFYAVSISNIPKEHRSSLIKDFEAISRITSSIEGLLLPKTRLYDFKDSYIFLIQDVSQGSSENVSSFFDALGFRFLTSMSDIYTNIVEGKEGYYPIDFEGFLRYDLTAEVTFCEYGAEYQTSVKIFEEALEDSKKEAERHNIEFNEEKLVKSVKNLIDTYREMAEILENHSFKKRATNLRNNISWVQENYPNRGKTC